VEQVLKGGGVAAALALIDQLEEKLAPLRDGIRGCAQGVP
jgi:hypothetical protein